MFSEYESDILKSLENICSILQKILEVDKKEKFKDASFYGVELFYNIFELVSRFDPKDFKTWLQKEPYQDWNSKIVNLLYENREWIKNILLNFTYIYLTEFYSPEIYYRIRSGIQYLFDVWGSFQCQNEELKLIFDPYDSIIHTIDEYFEKWIEYSCNRIKKKPKNSESLHSWWSKISDEIDEIVQVIYQFLKIL
jgi:hypothetical protein